MLRVNHTIAYVPANRERLIRAARRNQSELMVALLAGTTRAQNDAMLLVYVMDLRQEEAAVVLGCTHQAVDQRLKGAVEIATKNLSMRLVKKEKPSVYSK